MYDGFPYHLWRCGHYPVEHGVAAMLVIVDGTGMYDGFHFHSRRCVRYPVKDGVAAMHLILDGAGCAGVRCEWMTGACRMSVAGMTCMVLKYGGPTHMVDGFWR